MFLAQYIFTRCFNKDFFYKICEIILCIYFEICEKRFLKKFLNFLHFFGMNMIL